jgi:hypothetical protein
MARSARDLRLLLSIIEESPIPAQAPPAELKRLKVALWLDEPTFPLDADTKATKNNAGRFVDRLVNSNPKSKPRMPRVQQFSNLSSVGVLKPCCTTAADRTRVLTGAHPIKPTSTSRLSAWRPNLGRRSTYRCGDFVQTTGASSSRGLVT